MNTTLKVGDWVKFKGTRNFNPRLHAFNHTGVFRYYVERIDENTCHAETQTLCGLRAVLANGNCGHDLVSIPAFMLEPAAPFDWTDFDADVAKERARDEH